jgi:3D (Asp-Asp-Asp) domain-containing protein
MAVADTCLATLFMKRIYIKLASILLLSAVLVNPQPVKAAAISNPFAGLFAGKAVVDNAFDGKLEPAGYREARRTTVRLVSAYTSTVDQCDSTPFITANGTKVYDGIVAANWLKFGTRVRIPEMFGDKVFVVADRMHPRFDNRLDVWMTDYDDAVQFGLRRLSVEVL